MEEKIKRINEILEQGIEATGIDKNPIDTKKYGFAPEHGSVIRELEELELLDELVVLVGGEDELGELIYAIAKKQEEVSPRYQTQDFQNFDLEGQPIGKRAYGITTKELQQKEIQDLIKNFIDTPTNKDEVTEQLSKQVDNIAEKTNVTDQPIMYHGSSEPNVRMIPITETSKDAGKYLHTGTYKAAVDRRSGAFADQSIWNLGNSLNSHFEDQVGFNGPLREHFDDLIEQGVQPNEMPSYTNTVEYSIVTDKQYVSQAHIVAEINEDYIINVRLDWTENVNKPIRKTVDPSFAEVLYDDLTFEYDNYSTRPLNWTAHIQQSVPDPFSISFAYEIKPKDNAVIEVLDQGYIILSMKNKNYEPIIGTADTIINEYEVLQRQLPNSRIDWYDFDLVLSGNLNDVVRFYNDGTDTVAFSKLKQTSRPDFMNKLLSADILGYINDVEDPGSISYAVKNREAVDITRLNEQDTAKFQIDVDNRSMEMNTKPYNLFDETGELIEYSDDAMRSYRNGITSQFNRSSVQTPKQYTDQRTANYINNLRQQLPDVPGPGTGMGPGAALANNTAEFVNQLPIEQTLKDKTIERIGKHTAGLAAKAATPDPLQALDIYEDFVMLAGLAYAFAPDINTFVKNQANNMLETMAGAAGYKVKLQDFEYDWERVSDTMDWVESVSPTDIVIKKVGEVATGAAETGMVTGFGYIPKDLSSTLGNTLTTATTTKEKERDPMYDRIKRTFSGQY